MRKELGKWLMDIAKYMTTAFLLTSLLGDVKNSPWYVYVILVMAVLVTLMIGLLMCKESNNEQQK